MATAKLDVDKCRAAFPESRMGADYSVSVTSTKRTDEGFASTAKLFNAASPAEITLGNSSTNMPETIARAMEPIIRDNDEFIVSDADHEANTGSWVRLAQCKGLKLHHWVPKPSPGSKNPYAVSLRIEDLVPLLNQNTRLVAFTACSNILGEFVDVESVVKLIDVQKWDADYVFFSYYKVYGPHSAALYTRADSHKQLHSLAHYFLPTNEGSPYKLQPGGPGYERSYAVTAVLEYLYSLSPSGNDLSAAFDSIARHEADIMRPLIEFLLSPEAYNRGVRIVGPESADPQVRAPTISFVVVGDKPVRSPDIVKKFDELGDVGIRYGHFYAHRLFVRLGLDPDDGVVRISLVHYNTVAEAERLVKRLKEILL
ncbi:aminotransferase class-V protein [Rhizoctonia solani]|uniref:Aminotransferase class-V protein n=1 Tax=Rhizoctonia solani TaxID=456999 RepID=A0A8H8NW28_9AGAM|nr:aminotransferase class-V protein [Rhizoctonia solani]QRW20450.1 aminotransferase class-V protein [Rhizoctonia solani]